MQKVSVPGERATHNLSLVEHVIFTVSFIDFKLLFRPRASFHHTVDVSCNRLRSLIAGEWRTANITIRIHRF